eukprot:1460393-Rhodomonas_salina.1
MAEEHKTSRIYDSDAPGARSKDKCCIARTKCTAKGLDLPSVSTCTLAAQRYPESTSGYGAAHVSHYGMSGNDIYGYGCIHVLPLRGTGTLRGVVVSVYHATEWGGTEIGYGGTRDCEELERRLAETQCVWGGAW